MAIISQTTVSNSFPCMKIVIFQLKSHQNLFPMTSLIVQVFLINITQIAIMF